MIQQSKHAPERVVYIQPCTCTTSSSAPLKLHYWPCVLRRSSAQHKLAAYKLSPESSPEPLLWLSRSFCEA